VFPEKPARLSSNARDPKRAIGLPDEKVRAVQAAVLHWYRQGHRDLPWRRTRNPYAILVSEVMLQQTQVERVLPKYLEWMERYPTLAALAAASRAEVIRDWAPLGYNLRAVRLHEIARQAVELYGGHLPDTLEGLLSLKGIGRYTAGAVACFAFGRAEPVLDTNVRRVLGRIFAQESPGATEDDCQAWALAEAALPSPASEGRSPRSEDTSAPPNSDSRLRTSDCYAWNQALMDLGAMICVARNPRCLLCPAQTWCSARAEWFAPDVVQLPLDGAGNGVASEYRLRQVAEPPATYMVDRESSAQTRRSRKGGEGERFEGSRRWFRGRIVAALRDLPASESLDLCELGERVKPGFGAGELPWLRGLVEALARDGLVELTEGESEAARVALPR
jgi:A/G-specific adenine glycosylase